MCKKGYTTVEVQAVCVLFHQQIQLQFDAQVDKHNVGYLLCRTVSQLHNVLVASTTSEEELSLWHQHCSHTNLNDLCTVICKALVHSLTIHSKHTPDAICKLCLAKKLNRHSIPCFTSRKFVPIMLVHTDLKGKLPITTLKGHLDFCVQCDMFLGHCIFEVQE